MFVQRSTGSLYEAPLITSEEHTRVSDCSSPILSPKENESPLSSEPLKNRSIRQLNELSAAWASFLSRLLIERTFFQNTVVPRDALLYLANDLMRTLVPQTTETLSVSKELVIMWKQLRGQPLTAEEQAYENSPKEIDVVGEILNGVSLSATALIGKNLVGSIQSAITQGFWNHVPAIVGYSGTALLGSRGVAYAVNELLQQTSYTQEQKEWIMPWLNMVGRLALGFVPKVHATEGGVHYQYPSIEGSSRTFSKGQVATVHGDTLRIEKEGILDTSEGKFEAVYSADFKLLQVYELNEERIRIQVVDQSGKVVPVEFKRVEREFGPEIEVVCDDHQIAAYWNRIIRPVEDLPLIDSSNALNCPTSLALGAVGALSAQNVLPLALGAMACLKRVHADASSDATHKPGETGVAKTGKRYNPNEFDTYRQKTISVEDIMSRLKYLENKAEQNTANAKDIRELDELAAAISHEGDQNRFKIRRDDRAQFYYVELKISPARALTERFSDINGDITILDNDHTAAVISNMAISYSLASVLSEADNLMGFNFLHGLKGSYNANLLLTSAAGHLASSSKVFNTLIALVTASSTLYHHQTTLNDRFQSQASNYVRRAQKLLRQMAMRIDENRASPQENRILIAPASFDSINENIKKDAANIVTLCSEMDDQLERYLGEVDVVENAIVNGVNVITEANQDVRDLIGIIDILTQEKQRLIAKSQEILKKEKEFYERKEKEANSRKIEKREFHVMERRVAQWEEIHREDFKSHETWDEYEDLRKQAQNISNSIVSKEDFLAKALTKHIPSTGDTKENLEKASKALSASIVAVNELKKQVIRKRELLKDQKEMIEKKLQDSSIQSQGTPPILIQSLDDAINFLEDLSARIIGLRYMSELSTKQNKALVQVAEHEQHLRMLMTEEIRKGTFEQGAIERELAVIRGTLEKDALDISKLIAGSSQSNEKPTQKSQGEAPKGKEEL